MEQERKFNLTSKEQEQHKEVLRRQAILRGEAGEKMRRGVSRVLEEVEKGMTPEEITEAEAKRRQREEIKPWGI